VAAPPGGERRAELTLAFLARVGITDVGADGFCTTFKIILMTDVCNSSGKGAQPDRLKAGRDADRAASPGRKYYHSV